MKTYSVLIVQNLDNIDVSTLLTRMAQKYGITQIFDKSDLHIMSSSCFVYHSIINLMLEISKLGTSECPEDRDAYRLMTQDAKLQEVANTNMPTSLHGYTQLIELEARLIGIYNTSSKADKADGMGSIESIDDANFRHQVIGSYYYLFDLDERPKENGKDEATFRIYVGDATEETFGGKYRSQRSHDFEGKYLPYGVVRLEELEA